MSVKLAMKQILAAVIVVIALGFASSAAQAHSGHHHGPVATASHEATAPASQNAIAAEQSVSEAKIHSQNRAIGDGTFLYNPVIPALAFADEHNLPLLILVFNNAKYAAMQYYHDKFYPTGTAIAAKDYYGVDLKGVKYEQAAAMVDGYACRVETPAELKIALDQAIASMASGKSAIINMIMPAKVR